MESIPHGRKVLMQFIFNFFHLFIRIYMFKYKLEMRQKVNKYNIFYFQVRRMVFCSTGMEWFHGGMYYDLQRKRLKLRFIKY